MTLKDIKEAVERYRNKQESGVLDVEASLDIADALTDPTPIALETLQQLGFWEVPQSDDVHELHGDGWSLCFAASGPAKVWYVNREIANPQPKTNGQLIGLLIALEGK